MEAIGFKGSGMFVNQVCYSVYYRKVPSKCRVDVVTAYGTQTVSQFNLTKAQYRRFEDGKLSLVPPGCCSASGRPYLEDPKMLFEGTIKTIKHLKNILGDEAPLKSGVRPFAGSNVPRRTRVSGQGQ